MNRIAFFIFIIFSIAEAKDLNLAQWEEKKQSLLLKKTALASEINSISANIKIIEEQVFHKKQTLSKRISSTLLISRLKLNFFSYAHSYKQAERNLFLLKKINENDLAYIREQAYRIDDLKNEKNHLKMKVNELDALTKELEIQEKALLDQEAKVATHLRKMSLPSLLLLKGSLGTPIEAKVAIPYGAKKAENNPYILFHKGVKYHSTEGQIVQAVGPGRVIFSDVLNYWGESIILEHDGDYFSVYAGVKNCIVQLNQVVTQREPICEAANSDFYFELRHQNIAINPEKWIKDI